ncbi:MAG: DUF2066 domain-containing protein [Gammaproteobacteria bacterium]|uniref:DUF2066 domain-containing protein n=1 Tax=Stutzerimonas xanthomarina TaxID=271420 RepID=UPI000E9D77C6|nr:DUF2066 domain-containing protein [Stutzerimonas xanthomarina]MBU0810949.1 DUF2066 domain-containing protein [Gammaproteobacteria bacterium]HAW22477.1 DUF2066 domain-containing protein [Pseudomonas sp.]MBK3847107.1 DUF2066 domain-containing protein [Stutzerimonas xanthomarina]MBU0852552.1 DUF2066 domain-containing protein [Gammaproteobacteria bacterium]MBU1302534.1 DUF2066 domain-containing protein [Gammaproteobacteria bacterium]
MRVFPRLLALCCAVVSAHSMAAPLADLYKVREPVASQQPAEREEALRKAFDTLVLRLTGDSSSDQQAVAPLRSDPQQLVSRYAYEGDTVVVSFDPVTTERALRSAGLPLWGTERPSILTWWLRETADGSQLVGDAQEGSSDLRAAAQHRGLPLRLPLADLSEQLVATSDAVTAKDPQALRDVSERYDADGLLAVMAKQSGESWEADWRLWMGDKQTQGKASGDTRVALADEVMLAVSTFLAPQYRVKPGDRSEITLEVLGADVERFAELDRLLEPFGARLQQVASDRLVYRLNASPEQLRAQLALARLQEVAADEIDPQSMETADANGEVEPTGEGEVSAGSAEAQSDDTQTLEEPGTPAAEQSRPVEQGTLLRYRW